ARSREESETRFWNNVITAPPFDPLRERYGAAFEDFIRDKVVLVNGDIAEDNLGFTEEEARRVAEDIDVLVNSAGNVTFNPKKRAVAVYGSPFDVRILGEQDTLDGGEVLPGFTLDLSKLFAAVKK
ncbi:MAG TPA: SDR family oxidoreductase, partial [Pyrinomonadaceae bacterium]